MLGRLAMSVDECIEAFESLSANIFGHPRWLHAKNTAYILPIWKHNPERLEYAIKKIVERYDHLGPFRGALKQPNEDMCRTYVRPEQRPFISLTCSRIVLSYRDGQSTVERKPYLFRSYRHFKSGDPIERNPDAPTHYPIWQVLRATSAAPPYFKPIRLDKDDSYGYIDGGVGANNPSLEAWRSINQLHRTEPSDRAVEVLVSIGTGKKLEGKAHTKGLHSIIKALLGTGVDVLTDTFATHEQVRYAMRNTGDYFRFNVENGLGTIPLDACKGKDGTGTLDEIRQKTEDYLQKTDVQQQLKNSAKLLVDIRRSRSKSPDLDQWERFCHGVEYSCPLEGCTDTMRYSKRELLRQHFKHAHHRLVSPILPNGKKLNALFDEGKLFPLYEES